jgi:hypothetical protein
MIAPVIAISGHESCLGWPPRDVLQRNWQLIVQQTDERSVVGCLGCARRVEEVRVQRFGAVQPARAMDQRRGWQHELHLPNRTQL